VAFVPDLAQMASLEASFEMPTVSVVVPALNESRNLEHVFSRIPASVYEVVLVDGNSVDDTVAVARRLRPDVKVVQQNRRGKGNALVCGFAACTGDIIVTIDADGSTDPAEIPAFVAALTSGADFAKGSRFVIGGDSLDITRVRKLGNWALNRLVRVLFGIRFTDLCYGYNAFWARCVPAFGLAVGGAESRWGDGFEIETVINVRFARSGGRITEVASIEAPRIHGESHLNTFRDGWRVLRTIMQERRIAKTAAASHLYIPAQHEHHHVINLNPVDISAIANEA
jgi:glycosyltransferase involved in cell wall biosynthesis